MAKIGDPDYSYFETKPLHDEFDRLKLRQEVIAAATDTVFKVWRSQRGIEPWAELVNIYLSIRAQMAAKITID